MVNHTSKSFISCAYQLIRRLCISCLVHSDVLSRRRSSRWRRLLSGGFFLSILTREKEDDASEVDDGDQLDLVSMRKKMWKKRVKRTYEDPYPPYDVSAVSNFTATCLSGPFYAETVPYLLKNDERR